ncbi:Holliday junction resolvase RuvX [Candidatus Peregrinibacteria bacterium]|nr:Holliday junction resolvase RuvX [Candidatus Peregrinibacteria bacterium]
MHYLSLDIGMRHTGIAYGDDVAKIPLPLPTIHHRNTSELIASVSELLGKRNIDAIVVGLPLLPSGEEGSQARSVRECIPFLLAQGLPVTTIDERFTSASSRPQTSGIPAKNYDGDSAAACAILQSFLDRKEGLTR